MEQGEPWAVFEIAEGTIERSEWTLNRAFTGPIQLAMDYFLSINSIILNPSSITRFIPRAESSS